MTGKVENVRGGGDEAGKVAVAFFVTVFGDIDCCDRAPSQVFHYSH